MQSTDDIRIDDIRALVPASVLLDEFPISENASKVIFNARQQISKCIHGKDDRLVIVVGPCSVHDYDAAIEYGRRLVESAKKYENELVIIMRVYFEKPRTTVGWKGFINDPDLDDSFNINKGLRGARGLLLELSDMGMPCGTEYLDVISPQYVSDLISWGAIGARTTESQVHRELSSGLSCPIGFKNGTDGNMQVAVDAIKSSVSPHHFLGVTKNGTTAIFSTKGNKDTHIILRGGKTGPNYSEKHIAKAIEQQNHSGLSARLMVDCSHGNSEKDYTRQPIVSASVADMIARGDTNVFGLMVESHLEEGNQKISENMVYGKSVTDACVSWETTETILSNLADAVKIRRTL